MLSLAQIREVAVTAETKMVLLVMDGLGGLPDAGTGKTELESARTPNLDLLAAQGMCGLHEPVGPGITPGSGPGHLALFGYDPLRFLIGRGVLEGLGIDFPLQRDDLAARGNFCTIDDRGLVTDRRAGRIPTEQTAELCQILSRIRLPAVELFVRPVREHRFLAVFRGANLSSALEDTDPERLGVAPLDVKAVAPSAGPTASIVQSFVAQSRAALASRHPANMVLLRGFSKLPDMPQFDDIFRLRSAAVAIYPMYKGLARLVGMKVFHGGDSIRDGIAIVAREWANFDFFFLHFKKTDSAGEDGDFARKVAAIEEVDAALPRLLTLKPDVIAVTGDHSTPAPLKSHSWHSIPFLIHSRWCRPSRVAKFDEAACASGNLGVFSTVDVMPLTMAHALRLTKYGA